MIRAPFDENPIIACGWPWHGRADVDLTTATTNILLPNGLTKTFASNRFIPSHNSHVFDMGLADVPDEELEEAGGAWWGRALLRGDFPRLLSDPLWSFDNVPRYEYGRGLTPAVGVARFIAGAPLVIRPADEEQSAFRVFCQAYIRNGRIRVSVLRDRDVFALDRSIADAEIGQGAGQPDFACHAVIQSTGAAVSATVTAGNPGSYRGWVRDFTENRLLLGVYGIGAAGSPPAELPLSEVSTRSALRWPEQFVPLIGLVEIEVLPTLFDAGAAADQHIVIRVLEDRRSALGNPLHELSDVALPGGNRQYLSRWTQTGGLLNAFYDRAGELRTVRFNRLHESTLYRREIAGEGQSSYRQQDTARSTTLELIGVSGAPVDSFTLAEVTREIQRGPMLQVIRTVTATGEDDDVQDSGPVTGSASWLAPLPAFMPGFHLCHPVITQLYRINGENIISPQDLRCLWLLRNSNRSASLGFTREPYEHGRSAPVRIQKRPMATQSGAVGGVVNSVETKTAETVVRSFFYFENDTRCAYNAVTDEWVRRTGRHVYSWV